VADLGVAHDPSGQADAGAGGFDERVRVLLAQLVVEGHLGERDGVALARFAVAEAVEDDERERPLLFQQTPCLLLWFKGRAQTRRAGGLRTRSGWPGC
jgi:hypothetical protein